MTTERRQHNGRRWSRITGTIILVVASWLVIVVALTFGSAPGKSMAVVGPQSHALAAIAKANGRIIASNDYFTLARSDESGFVARLYASGALLVLDAEQAGGCTGLSPSLRAKRLVRRSSESDGGSSASLS
jgi:hypothetical protein